MIKFLVPMPQSAIIFTLLLALSNDAFASSAGLYWIAIGLYSCIGGVIGLFVALCLRKSLLLGFIFGFLAGFAGMWLYILFR